MSPSPFPGFPLRYPDGPALGDPERTTWGQFCGVFWLRREGIKDGPNFVPARFSLEADGRHVRRLKTNLVARTAIALDLETNKKTGEIPPNPDEAIRRTEAKGLACLLYTSHSHRPPDIIRYRMVMPLSEEIAPELPAPLVMAEALGLRRRSGPVQDRGGSHCSTCRRVLTGLLDVHQEIIIPGAPIDAAWLTAALAARQTEETALRRSPKPRRRPDGKPRWQQASIPPIH